MIELKRSINRFLGLFLGNQIIGIIIKFFFKKVKRYNLVIDLSNNIISPKIAAYIFFKMYESSEIRFIKKYLNNDLPVVELGSSLGIVGSIASQITSKNVFGYEANPILKEYSKNLIVENHVMNYQINNYALYFENKKISFSINENNTTGKINNSKNIEQIEVEGISFDQVIKNTNIKGSYTLISDIEGAEIFFINCGNDLSNCKTIIVELHEFEFQNQFYTPLLMELEIIKKGYEKIDSYGNCFVFKRKENA